MHPIKEIYAKKVLAFVHSACEKLSKNDKAPIFTVLHTSDEEMLSIIHKIMIALPDRHFYNATPSMLDDMSIILTKNIIFFQAQERLEDVNYPNHLINFIENLSYEFDERYTSANLRNGA